MDNKLLSHELRARVALDRHGFRNIHTLGQNFILHEDLLDGLLDAAGISTDDNVLEIGPGPGLTTALLAGRCRNVVAVEIDRGLEPVLKEVLAGIDNARVVFQDILKTDVGALSAQAFGDAPWRVVANLPYYITADIILRLVTASRRPDSIAVMVQREAAERVMSRPGSKQWCALSATVQYYGAPRVLTNVPPDVFTPQPHVQSQFILIERHANPAVRPLDEALFLKLIGAAFAMRRKTLANNLKASFGLDQAGARALLAEAGLDERMRGEALSLEALCDVANLLTMRKDG